MIGGASAETKLNAVINSARTILQTQTFQESARTIFDHCRELTGAVSGYAALLNERTSSLESALLQVRTLHGLLPICSHCKRIRDDQGCWTPVESRISSRTDAQFTHGLCPVCLQEFYPEYSRNEPGAQDPVSGSGQVESRMDPKK